jgi:hypothetical protein
MIKEKKIKVLCGGKNIPYYKSLGYNPKNMKYMTVLIKDLPKGSDVKITAICKCGNETIITYYKYNENIKRCGYYGCRKCSRSKAKETSLVKYGVENYVMTNEHKELYKTKCLDKYGVTNTLLLPEIQEKIKQTNIKKFGSEYALCNKDVQAKRYKTFEDKHGKGITGYNQTKEFQENVYHNWLNVTIPKFIKKYSLETLFIEAYYETDSVKLKCDVCNKEYIIDRKNFRQRMGLYNMKPCTLCTPLDTHVSYEEDQIFNYIKNNTSYTIEKFKIEYKEIDIYVKELQFGFEYNGLYWHSDKFKDKHHHYKKQKFFEDNGHTIYTIWEDHWKLKQPIVKAFIDRTVGITSSYNHIYPSECTISTINKSELNTFINDNELYPNLKYTHNITLSHSSNIKSTLTYNIKANTINITNIVLSNDNMDYNYIKVMIYQLYSLYPTYEILFKVKKSYLNLNNYKSMGFELIKNTKHSIHVVNESFKDNHKFNIYDTGEYILKYIPTMA